MSKTWVAIGIIVVPSLGAAHLGHAAGEDFGFAHYLLDPVHAALTGTGVLLWLTVRRFARGRRAVDRCKQ